jgi:hypothetical protein
LLEKGGVGDIDFKRQRENDSKKKPLQTEDAKASEGNGEVKVAESITSFVIYH